MSLIERDAKWVYAICMVTSFLVPFMISSLNLAMPSIGLAFHSSQYLLNWVAASFLLVTGSLLLPMGKLADLTGRVRIFKLGLALFFLGTAVCMFAPSIKWLIAMRAIQGIGASMIFSTAVALLTMVVPPQERGRAMGINVAIVYFSYSAGPILGGWICSYFGWQGIFGLLAVLTLGVLAVSLLKLHGPWTPPDPAHMDVQGSLLCVTGLVLFLYGSSSLSLSSSYWGMTVLGLAILVAFVLQERRAAHPILPISLFTHNRVFAFSNLSSVINYSSIFAMPFLISFYLQTVRGVPLRSAGGILLVQPVLMALLSPVVGRLSDRLDPRILSSVGMAVNSLGLFFFAFLTEGSSVPLILLNLAFVGLGYALFSSPNINAIMGSVDRSQYGVASSAMGTARVVGQALSMAIVSLITTHFVGAWTIGTPGYGSHFLMGMKACFLVFALLNLVGVFASLARGTARSSAPLQV